MSATLEHDATTMRSGGFRPARLTNLREEAAMVVTLAVAPVAFYVCAPLALLGVVPGWVVAMPLVTLPLVWLGWDTEAPLPATARLVQDAPVPGEDADVEAAPSAAP